MNRRKLSYPSRKFVVAAIAGIAGVFGASMPAFASPAAGNVATWTGGASTSWSGTANWLTPSPSGAPTTSGTWSLYFSGTNRTTNSNNIGTITLGTMAFTNNGSAGNSGAFALSGSTLSLSNGLIVTTATSTGSAITDSIGNAVSLTGANTFAFGSNHNITISGNISGAGGFTKSGDGSLFLTGSNGQFGTTYITGGNVRTGASGASTTSNNFAFGSGDVVVSGSGTLTVRNNSTIGNNLSLGGTGWTASNSSLLGSFASSSATAVISGSVGLTSDTTISSYGSDGVSNSKLSLAGPINLGGNTLKFSQVITSTTAPVLNAPATWITVGGAIGGTGSVIIDGTASVFWNGANTYSGTTTVQSGVLSGNGSIAGAVVVRNGAMITTGSAANVTGELGVGSLQLDSGATALMQISGSTAGLFDQIVATSGVNYGGTLSISFGSSGFSDFTAWQLFSGASHSGHFSTVLASGSFGSLTFTDHGNGEWGATGGSLGDGRELLFFENDIHAVGNLFKAGQLVLVPEPSTFVFAGVGLFVMGWQRLMRRRRSLSNAANVTTAVEQPLSI